MYCENCGKRLNEMDLYCSECGIKVNKIELSENKNSAKTIWIVLGCIFGGIILIPIIIFFITFFIIIDNANTIDDFEEYELKEYYDYENINNSYIYKDDTEVIKIK